MDADMERSNADARNDLWSRAVKHLRLALDHEHAVVARYRLGECNASDVRQAAMVVSAAVTHMLHVNDNLFQGLAWKASGEACITHVRASPAHQTTNPLSSDWGGVDTRDSTRAA
jgi:hypothetical protein